jgi:hypothetical protein
VIKDISGGISAHFLPARWGATSFWRVGKTIAQILDFGNTFRN